MSEPRRRSTDENDPLIILSGVIHTLEGSASITAEMRKFLSEEVRSAREIWEHPSKDPIQNQIETGALVVWRTTEMVAFTHPDGTPGRRARITDAVGYHWGMGQLHDGLVRRMNRQQQHTPTEATTA